MSHSISLKNWKQTLRPYQEEAVKTALAVSKRGTLLLAAPTGSGKGTMQLGLLSKLRAAGEEAWIVTPSIEVLRGYLERCGATPKDLDGGTGTLTSLGQQIYVTTPIRMRNRIQKGKMSKMPTTVIVDEAHHATMDTIAGGGLRELIPGIRWIGWTATPYRGTPEETQELKDYWGTPHVVLSIPDAVTNGAWNLPTWLIEPLVNDDTLGVRNGDVDADEATLEVISPLANLIKTLDLSVPTCVTVPSVKSAENLMAELTDVHGLDPRLVVGKTPTTERAAAYEHVKQGGSILVSVKVLGEGVDLPWLDRWVDASPTISPVSFIQKLGRITRPGRPKFYVGTNRNLERFGYLLQGTLPRSEFKKIQERFGEPTTRVPVTRVPGLLKSPGKAKPIELPLEGGITGTMFALWHPNKAGGGYERIIILDPLSDHAVSATRTVDMSKTDPKDKFGAWTVEPDGPPAVIDTYRANGLSGNVSPKQHAYWKSQASPCGLDSSVLPSKAQFYVLPALIELGGTLRNGLRLDPTKPKPAPAATPEDRVHDTSAVQPAVPDGYYTVVDGEAHRTYRIKTRDLENAQTSGDYWYDQRPGMQVFSRLVGPENTRDYQGTGWIYGERLETWRRWWSSSYELRRDYDIIRGGAEECGKAYALKSRTCWICNRDLTTPGSIESGIGPECAEKWGMFWGRKAHEEHLSVQDTVADKAAEEALARREAFKAEETAGESNIPLMKRLLKAYDEDKINRDEIDQIYLRRYKLLKGEDKSLSWIRKRIETYRRIAKEELAKEGWYSKRFY